MSIKISIAVPVHNMQNRRFFIDRLEKSLEEQTFQDFEVVVTEDGKMAENTNSAIKKSKGEIIKVLYMDDYLAHKDALKNLAEAEPFDWLATGCDHDFNGQKHNPHLPSFEGILKGINTIGSPSVVAFRNDKPLLFDEKLSWLLDVDLYQRLYLKYGPPKLLDTIDTTIGIHEGQMTNILTDEEKQQEVDYLKSLIRKTI